MFRRAQGSLEYTFMVAAALVIIAIAVWRLFGVRGLADEGGRYINTSQKHINKELANMTENLTS